MYACWYECIEVCCDSSYESLSLSCTHFCYVFVMETQCADELYIVGDHTPRDHMPITEIELSSIYELTGTSMECKCLMLDRLEDLIDSYPIIWIIYIESLEA